MRKSKAACAKTNLYLADMVLDRRRVSAAAEDHFALCSACALELASMESTMRVLDEWRAPNPGAFFDTRLNARLRSEKASAPAYLFERMRAWTLYSSDLHIRPWVTAAAAALLVVGSGTFTLLKHQTQPVEVSATVSDLQCYDGNAEVLEQLNCLGSDKER